MRTLLIVSPHFPPINGADTHRVRMSLPHFTEFGWRPVVLAVKPEFVEGIQDPLLLETIPADVPIRRVSALPVRWTRKVGVGALALRAFPFLNRGGVDLIREYKPALTYFSTTMFPAMALGRIWQKKFGVPYVLDMQDPWVSDYYEGKDKSERPPKYKLAQRMHKFLEPWTMKKVGGIVAVSEKYHETLRQRYPWIAEDVCRTIPFGASAADFEVAAKSNRPNTWFAKGDGFTHGVYVGVLGRVMKQTCRAICLALKLGLATQPGLFSKVRLHFIGTDYAAGDRATPTIRPIAEEMGLENQIEEQTRRVPYFQALKLLKEADFLLVPGSDNPHYTASKIYPYILAQRPLLAVFHGESSVVKVVESTNAGCVVRFTNGTAPEEIAQSLLPAWTELLARLPYTPATDWNAFQLYTARELTRQQCELFDQVVAADVRRRTVSG